MIVVPTDLIPQLHLEEGSQIGMEISDGKLRVRPRFRYYDLEELLARCDPSLPLSEEDQAWLNMKPVGREIL